MLGLDLRPGMMTESQSRCLLTDEKKQGRLLLGAPQAGRQIFLHSNVSKCGIHSDRNPPSPP